MLWLLLALTAALASPLVRPQSVELLCTGTGSVILLIGSGDDADLKTGHTHDCTPCAQASAPPVSKPAVAAPAPVNVYALHALPFARPAWPAAPPMPARGPPKTRLA
jgi:hypothetical protein